MSADPFASVAVTKPGRSRTQMARPRQEEDDPFAAVEVRTTRPARARQVTPLAPVQVTAEAPKNPLEMALSRAQLAQRGQLQGEFVERKPKPPVRAFDKTLAAGRGLAESGYMTAQGVANILDRLPVVEGAGEAVRRSREEMRQFYGEPESDAARAAMLGTQMLGTGAQFFIPGAAASRAAQAAQAGSRIQRALQMAAAPLGEGGAVRTAASRVLGGTVMASPLNLAVSQSPEDAAAPVIAQATAGAQNPVLRAIGQVAERASQSPVGRFAFETGLDVLAGGAGETLLAGARGARRLAGTAMPEAPMPAIPSKPTQETIDRAAFTSKMARALEAGNDREVTRLLERQQQLRPLDEQLEDALDRQANARGKKAKQRADAEVERVLTLMDQQALPVQGPQQWRGPQRFAADPDQMTVREELVDVGQKAFERLKQMQPGLSTQEVTPDFISSLYSRVGRQIEKAPFIKGTGQQWAAQLAKNTAKGEREFTGIDTFLQQNADKVLSRKDVQEFFNANRVQLTETRYGAGARRQLTPDEWEPIQSKFKQVVDSAPTMSRQNRLELAQQLLYGTPLARRGKIGPDTIYELALDIVEDPDKLPGSFLEAGSSPVFGKYAVPGLRSNYREVLLQQPGQEQFRYSAHWDEPNVMTHVRMSDRTIDGKKTLFVEELQDDWAQQARKPVGPKDPETGKQPTRGYRTAEESREAASLAEQQQRETDEMRGLRRQMNRAIDSASSARQQRLALEQQGAQPDVIADLRRQELEYTKQHVELLGQLDELSAQNLATTSRLRAIGMYSPQGPLPGLRPFKQTPEWSELGIKRAIDEAVRGGYDQVALVTGEQAADMFSLRKQVDSLQWRVGDDPEYGTLIGYKNGRQVLDEETTSYELDNMVGSELARELRSRAGESEDLVGQVSGEELSIGGKGMQKFYNEMLPNVIKDYSKKLGVPLTVRRLSGQTVEEMQQELARLQQVRTQLTDQAEIDDVNKQMLSLRSQIADAKTEKPLVGNLVIDITPQLREKVLTEGQPLWAAGGDAGLALGGGLAGGTQGETEEERMRNALLFAGALGGARKLRQSVTQRLPEVSTFMNVMREGTQQAERRGLVANVELATMQDPRFTGIEQLGEDALEMQLGAINGTVEPLANALNLRMGQDVQAKPSFGLWFGENANADVQPSVLLEFSPSVDQRKALALVAEYSRIAKQKALFYLAPDDKGSRTALSFVVRDPDGTPMPSNLVLDLLRENRYGWNGAMITDDGVRTVLVLDEKLAPNKIESELNRLESVVEQAGFTVDPEQARVGRVNAAEIGDKGYMALVNSAGVDRGTWVRAVRNAERLYEGVAVTAEKRIAARRIFDRPDADIIELNLDPTELAAVRTPPRRGKPGQIFTGPNHMVANGKAARAGFSQATTEAGYTLTNGEFVNRYEGEAVMELMAERGDAIAAKAVDAVQGREESGATSWLRSEDLYAAGRGGKLEKRAAEQASRFGMEGKAYDIGGAFGEGVTELSRTPEGRRLLGNVALGTTGYALTGDDDELLRNTGKGMMALALGSAVYPALKVGVQQGAKGLAEQMKQTARGRYALNLLSRDITTDPAVRKAVEDALAERSQITAQFQELSRRARELGPQADRVVSDLLEGEAFAAREMAQMSPDDVATATALAQRIASQVRELGARKVEEDLISEQTFLKRAETYLPRLYAKYDADGLVNEVTATHRGKTFRITGEKIRNDALTPEERDALGEIREASYRLAEAGKRGAQDISTARLFRTLADMPGVIHPEFKAAKENELMAQLFAKQALKTGDQSAAREAFRAAREARAEAKQLAETFTQPNYATQWLKQAAEGKGYVRLPDTPNMGQLRGAVVRADVADYLHDLPDLASTPGHYRNLLRLWKEIKTVYNVGTQLTNVLSNFAVVHAAGIPWWKQAARFRGAARDLTSYGPATKALTEAGVMGVNMPGFGDVPVKNVASDVSALRQLAETTRPETRQALAQEGITPYGKLAKMGVKGSTKAKQYYAAGDGIFRVMLYQKYLKDGLSSDEAIQEVMRNMPSYDTRSPILGALRMGPAPFIMYPAKYLPTALDNIMMHPYRWATLAGTTWALMDQASRRLYGKIEEEDLPPNRRRSETFGYLLPGVTQIDAAMRPVLKALGRTPDEERKYTIDAARFTPLSALTGSPVPGTDLSSQLLGERAPQILQPSGPLMDIAALAMGKNAYTGEDFFSPSDEPLDKALKLGGWASRMALPTFLGVHTPRVIGDVRRGDLDAAITNALGILGMRPTMVTPGMQSQLQQRRFEEQMSDARLKLRQELRKAKTPEEEARIEQKYEAKMTRLAAKYQQRLDEEEE